MERLTERDELGNAYMVGTDNYFPFYDKDMLDNVVNKLAAYEDLEEQGRLIKLPFIIGQKLYYPYIDIIDGQKKISEMEVSGFKVTYEIGNGEEFPLEDIGVNTYLTRQEAEEALNKMSAT